jgi:hypothetical protein
MESGYTASPESWIAILSISTRLLFDAVRMRAIQEISERLDLIDAVELLLVAKQRKRLDRANACEYRGERQHVDGH